MWLLFRTSNQPIEMQNEIIKDIGGDLNLVFLTQDSKGDLAVTL